MCYVRQVLEYHASGGGILESEWTLGMAGMTELIPFVLVPQDTLRVARSAHTIVAVVKAGLILLNAYYK